MNFRRLAVAFLALTTVAARGQTGPGTVQVTSASTYSVVNGVGQFTVPVSRFGGSSGAVGVSYQTMDGTALAGRDYNTASGTLAWADGDTADKTVQITIINQAPFQGERTFTLVLSNPTGGVTIGRADATLTVYNTPIVAPTIGVASPPAGIPLTTGDALPLAANVTDPSGVLSNVQFFIGGQLVGEAAAPGPYTFDAVAPAAGDYQLQMIAVDLQGNQIAASQDLSIEAADPTNPPPTSGILSDLGGRALSAGAQVSLSASALDADGQPVQELDFYADGVMFASQQPAASLRRLLLLREREALPRAAGAGQPAGAIFSAKFTVPGVSKLISLITVAISHAGHAHISSPVTVQAVAGSADHAPNVSLSGLQNGATVPVGQTIHIPASVVDPDGPAPSAKLHAPVRKDFGVSAVISKVEYYLNDLKVKEAMSPPYGFDIAPPSEGAYVVSAIATDGSGLAGVSDPITLEASASPLVSIAALHDGVAVKSGRNAKVVFSRVGGDVTMDLPVDYKIKSGAANGVDFATPSGAALSGAIVIPAGASVKKLKVSDVAPASLPNHTRVKFELIPSASGGYLTGASASAKIFLDDVDPLSP